MQRSVDKPGDGRIQWRKLGRGFFRLPNRIIKPGQIFWAHPSEIPEAFRDTIIPVDAKELKEEKKTQLPTRASLQARREQRMVRRNTILQQKKEEETIDAVKPKYNIIARGEGSPWYDIFDENGKQMNAKALRLEKAEEFKKSLEE